MRCPALAAASWLSLLAVLLPGPALADVPWYRDLVSYQNGDLGDIPKQTFKSAPDIAAPVYQVNKFDLEKVDTDNPYMFTTGRYTDWGFSIVSSKDLSLVYADQRYGDLVQHGQTWENFQGRRVLSVFADNAVRIFDQNYTELYVVTPQGLPGAVADSHEAMITEDDTVLMAVWHPIPMDLRPVGGPQDGQAANCLVQEVDPTTNEVLFQFSTLDYFKLEDTYWTELEPVFDFCHMNSVEKTAEGNFLISYRHLSCVILVDGKTAQVIWVMWGKKNMFTDISENGSAEFHYQHQPRVSGPNRFTLFDNHDLDHGFCSTPSKCSRGLEVEYDAEALTVKMINEWYHPQSLTSASRGGVQRTSTGNVVIAWGQNPMYTEYTPDGEVVMDIQRGRVVLVPHGIAEVITYRIWKGQWVGNPSWGPSMACDGPQHYRHAYVSWNGATEVARWALLLASEATKLDGSLGVHSWSDRQGFETAFTFDEGHRRYARIAAVDAGGKILGATPVVKLSSGELTEVDYDVRTLDHMQEDLGGDEDAEPSPLIMALGGISFMCIALTITMLACRRQRRPARRSDGGAEESEAVEGLLSHGDVDGYEAESESYQYGRDDTTTTKKQKNRSWQTR